MKQRHISSQKELESLTKQIVEGYDPDKIILFGSFAEGKPHKDSDYDLFIIKETKEKFFDRMSSVRRTLYKYPSRGLDILVYTPSELEQTKNYFIDTILSNGSMLYEKKRVHPRGRRLDKTGRR